MGLLLGLAAFAAASLCLATPARAARGLRVELGPTYEFTNLIYRATEASFQTLVCDSIFPDSTQRDSCLEAAVFNDSLVVASSPEAARGLFTRVTLADTAGLDRYYFLEPELRLADKLVLAHLNGSLRWSGNGALILGLDQRFDHSLDERFGLSRRLDSELLTGTLGYRSPGLSWSFGLRPALQVDRTNKSPASFIQNSNSGRLELDGSYLGATGALLDLDAHLARRVYPDSALRDYREGYAAGRWSLPATGLFRPTLAGEYERRTGDRQAERHDLFHRWESEAQLDLLNDRWLAHLRGQAEWLDYANPDEIFFRNRLYRVEISGGRTVGRLAEIQLRPRVDWLRAPQLPEEAYRQLSLGLTITAVGRGFVDLALEAGRRRYEIPGGSASFDTTGLVATHSDYHLYNASMVFTRNIGGALKLRGSLDYSLEVHDRVADNNHVVFLSSDLGYQFDWRR